MSTILEKFLESWSHPPLSGTGKEIHFQMEISLIDVNIASQRVITSTPFFELHCVCCFVKITSFK